MTYNLGHYDYGVGVGIPDNIFSEKLTNYRNFLKTCGADILGLQEYATYIDKQNTITSDTALFNINYPEKGGSTNLWCALKSKYLFYNRASGSFGNRPYNCAMMNIKGKEVFIISVHFSPGASNANLRISEAHQLISLVSQYNYFIICGDFNPEPNEEDTLFQLFSAQGMNLANCGSFGKIVTYHNDPRYIIDNIITSGNITITEAYSLDVYNELSSDHLPLFAKLHI